MTPRHFLLVWQAETEKLFSRLTARAGLAIAALIGVLGPFALWWFGTSSIIWNGAPLADKVDKLAPEGVEWALLLHSFFVLRVLIIMVGTLVLAGEHRAGTLREDALRPVPRAAIPIAKWLALGVWIAAMLAVTFVLSSVLGVVVFGFAGPWGEVAVGYGARFLTDLGFAALVIGVSTAFRSIVGTLGGLFLFEVFDTLLGWALSGLDALSQVVELPGPLPWLVLAKPWMPSSAFSAWGGYAAEVPWEWQNFVTLGIITVASLAVAEIVFRRVDLP